MPPKWMWSIDEELNDHFEWVKEQRESPSDRDDDDDEAGPMMRNDYARDRGKNAR